MTVKRFTEQEKLLLRKNPYTYRVTDNMILLTVEFKETFWKLYIQGFSPVSIFRELGYDPDLLKCTLFTGHPVRRVHFALYD